MELSDELNAVNSILAALPVGYSYKFHEGKILVKEIVDQEWSQKWIRDLQSSPSNAWRVHRMRGATSDTVLFKKKLKCHYNRQSYSITNLAKNCDCPAFITMIVNRYDPESAEKTSEDPDYPCVIEFCLEHNHAFAKVAVPSRVKPFTKEAREKLLDLFQKGHTPAVARQILKVDQFSQDADTALSVLPELDAVRNLRFHGFTKKGLEPCENPEKYLVELSESYNRETEYGQAVYGLVGGDKFVALCTPIMFRAHTVLPESSELVIVDSFGNKGEQLRIHMLQSTGLPGGVPLGCVITEVTRREVLEVALEQLIQIMPAESFHGQTRPTIVVTNNDVKERTAFSKVWTESMSLTNQSALLETHWKWLQARVNNIEIIDRQSIYLSFKKIVHAATEEEFDQSYNNHIQRFKRYQSYVKYVGSLYENRREWANYCRPKITTENCAETLLRILRKDIIERVMDSNLPQLVDFLLTRYETYMYKRLVDFAQDKITRESIGKFMPPATKDIDVSNILRIEEDETCFYVPCAKNYGVTYFVDSRHGFCSCEQRRTTKLCEHLSAVMQQCCLTDEMFATWNQLKVPAIEIASGSKPQIHSDPISRDEESNCDVATRHADPCVLLVGHSPPNFNFVPVVEPLDCALDSDVIENALPDIDSRQVDSSNIDVELLDSLSESELVELRGIFERIITGTQTNPGQFVPAARAMLENVGKYVQTESDLVAAVQNFGKLTENCGKLTEFQSNYLKTTLIESTPEARKGVKRRAPLETLNDESDPSVEANNYNQSIE